MIWSEQAAVERMEEMRVVVARLFGFNEATWPSHGNVTGEICSILLRQKSDLDRKEQENKALRAQIQRQHDMMRQIEKRRHFIIRSFMEEVMALLPPAQERVLKSAGNNEDGK